MPHADDHSGHASAGGGGQQPAAIDRKGATDVNTNPLTMLPAKVRQVIYVVYGMVALVGTAIAAYYTALPKLTVPDQVTGGLAVIGALAAPISVLAANNVRRDHSTK